ncbi:MAG: c-type cytochrome [Anaerolineae bacterium]
MTLAGDFDSLYTEADMIRLLILALGFLAACAAQPTPTVVPPTPAAANETTLPTLDPDEIVLGAQIYADNCAECHGADLEGEADWKMQNPDGSFRSPPHDETGHTWHHPDDQLMDAIRRGGSRFEGMNIGGSSNMPAFAETLTEAQMTAVLTYIKSHWPDDIRQIQWQMSQQVRE